MRYIILCGLFILLANCSVTMPKKYQNSNGHSITTILSRFGAPNRKVQLDEGKVIYFYTKTNPNYAKVSTSPPVQMHVDPSGKPVMITKPLGIPEKSVTFSCTIMFVVDRRGIIIDSQVQGEGCHESIF